MHAHLHTCPTVQSSFIDSLNISFLPPLFLKETICTLKRPSQEDPATKPSLFLLFRTTEKRRVSHFIIICMALQLELSTSTAETAKSLIFQDIRVITGLWWRET